VLELELEDGLEEELGVEREGCELLEDEEDELDPPPPPGL
jgi:hypothetical protein